MLTKQIIKAGPPKPNSVIMNVGVNVKRGQSEDDAIAEAMKQYNFTDADVKSGKVRLKIYYEEKLFPNANRLTNKE